MEEAQRFLRYVLPGTASGIEFLVLVSLSWQSWSNVGSFPTLNLTIPVSALLLSATLGYIFSLFHHVLLWTVYECLDWTHDYRPLLRHAEANGWLVLTLLERSESDYIALANRLTTKGAWRLVTALWHENAGKFSHIGSANPRSNTLADLVHAAGAAFVGSVVAAITWIIVVLRSTQMQFQCLAVIVAIIIVVVHLAGVVITLRHSESFVQMVLGDALRAESQSNGKPVHGVVTNRDLAT